MNILLVITDQQRADALGFLGGEGYSTPHLDALAGRGTAFTRCVTPSPICGPARTAMFTGRYPHAARGVMDGDPLGEFHGEVAWRMATDNRFKYVWNEGDREELYDLVADPGEMVNLAGREGVRDVEEGLRGALREWIG